MINNIELQMQPFLIVKVNAINICKRYSRSGICSAEGHSSIIVVHQRANQYYFGGNMIFEKSTSILNIDVWVDPKLLSKNQV